MKRFTATKTLEIKAEADAIFKLACPVEELKWIRNWSYELIYSDSGVNENNCIFTETVSGALLFGTAEPTFWQTTLHDKEARVFHALLIYGTQATCKFEWTVNESDTGVHTATWRVTLTSLGDEFNEDLTEKLAYWLEFLSSCAKHYCETGEML
jgi:hypothetical protein